MTSISIPFSITNGGKVASTTNSEIVAKQKIIDVLTTGKNERVMLPDYGASAMDLMFEPVDDLVFGEFRIDALSELSRYTTGVAVEDVIVRPASPFEFDDYESSLTVQVLYKIGPFDRSSFTFSLANPATLTQESPL